MRIETGKISGNFELRGELDLRGMCTGHITVMPGGNLILRGMARGVVVAKGGQATIHGMCNGPVVNKGGDVVLKGKADSVITEEGQTTIEPGADVDGVVYDARSGVPRWFMLPDASEYQAMRYQLDEGLDDSEIIASILARYGAEDSEDARQTAEMLLEVAKGIRSTSSLIRELGGHLPSNDTQ